MASALRNIWQNVRRYVNKYVLVVIIFLVMILFIDDHNVFQRFSYRKKINELKKEIRYYENENEKIIQKLEELHSNDEDLEQFAREEYLMKKPNEDIFIFE